MTNFGHMQIIVREGNVYEGNNKRITKLGELFCLLNIYTKTGIVQIYYLLSCQPRVTVTSYFFIIVSKTLTGTLHLS